MYCKNCGEQIDDSAVVCPKCGVRTEQTFSVPGDEKMWAMLCHLLPLIFIFSSPYLAFLAPLLILMVKGRESALVDDQGKESLNFHISLMIYWAGVILVGITIVGLVIAIPAAIALFFFQAIAMIIASVRANNGEYYRYPLAIRFIN